MISTTQRYSHCGSSWVSAETKAITWGGRSIISEGRIISALITTRFWIMVAIPPMRSISCWRSRWAASPRASTKSNSPSYPKPSTNPSRTRMPAATWISTKLNLHNRSSTHSHNYSRTSPNRSAAYVTMRSTRVSTLQYCSVNILITATVSRTGWPSRRTVLFARRRSMWTTFISTSQWRARANCNSKTTNDIWCQHHNKLISDRLFQ